MNIFFNHLVHGAVGLAAMASVGLGGSVVAQHVQAHADTKTRVEIEHKDKGDKNEIKRPTPKPAVVDIVIGAKGRVLVHGATVTGVSGTSVSAKSSVGASTINWVVNTGSARLITRGGSTTTLSSIAVSDTINFAGKLSSTTAFTVDASIFRDTTR